MHRLFSAWFPHTLAVLLAGCCLLPWTAFPQEDTAYSPVATADPTIPSEELEYLLAPLTRDELLVEAEAWQEVVKAKASEIAHALVAVSRQNLEIEKAREAKAQAEAARAELAQAEADAAGGAQSGAAEEAQERLQAVAEIAEELNEAEEKTAEVQGDLPEAGRDTVATSTQATERAKEVVSAVQETDDRGQAAEQAEEAMGEAKAVKEEAKVDLLEQITSLREERVLLIDNMRTVVDELEAKTHSEDTETLAVIQGHRLYMRQVSGISFDATDTTSVWVAISGWLTSREGGIRWAINIGTFVGILLVTWIAARVARRLLRRFAARMKWPTLLNHFAVRIAHIVVWIAGCIWALSSLEVSMAPLLAMVGAAGFIVAFAMQDSLSNFASGIMILMFQPFDVGDVVDAGGVSGKVESMNLVSTTIKTFDNKLMVLPNNKIWGDVITNASSVSERRVDLEFGIGYDDDIDRAHEVLEELVANHPLVLEHPEPTIRVNTLADSSVNFICRPWAKTADYWTVYWDLTKAVKKRFDDEGIGIPFPQRDVHLYVQDGQPAPVPGGPAGDEATASNGRVGLEGVGRQDDPSG